MLSEKKMQQIKEMPIIETKVLRSKDGKYLLHKTTITSIRPMAYYEAIIANNIRADEEDLSEDMQAFLEA